MLINSNTLKDMIATESNDLADIHIDEVLDLIRALEARSKANGSEEKDTIHNLVYEKVANDLNEGTAVIIDGELFKTVLVKV